MAVAYQALQLSIAADDKMAADSLKNIKVTSTNLNGLYEKATVNLSMYKLQAPGRIFRERYWQNPDQFVMTKNEYYTNFPYDVYADEDQEIMWPTGQKTLDLNDTTSANGHWSIVNEKQGAG